MPTDDEAGCPGLYITFWHGLWVPKGTPQDVSPSSTPPSSRRSPIRRCGSGSPIGQEIPPREQQTPEALGAHQKAEIEKWWPIIKAAGIKAE